MTIGGVPTFSHVEGTVRIAHVLAPYDTIQYDNSRQNNKRGREGGKEDESMN